MRLGVMAIELAVLAAGCSDTGGSTNDATTTNQANASAANGTDYVASVRAMTPELRKATLLRAIRDAKQACQAVTQEQETTGAEGGIAWSARCEDGRGWLIAIAPNGDAKVTGPVAAR